MASLSSCLREFSVSLDRTTIKAFVQPTLTCKGSTPCPEAVALIQENAIQATVPPSEATHHHYIDTTHLVLVDYQNQAMGVLPTVSIVCNWLRIQALSPQSPQTESPTITEFGATTLEPLILLPDNLTLHQVGQHLSQFTPTRPSHWAVVDHSTGQFLGLLDTPRLLQALAEDKPSHQWDLSDSNVQLNPDALQFTQRQAPDDPLTPTPPNPAQDDLLATVSHDLKTPLTAIVGLSNVLQDQRLGSLTKRQGRYIELIHQKGHQLITIVNDLLDLSQIKSRQLSLNTQAIEDPSDTLPERDHPSTSPIPIGRSRPKHFNPRDSA